MTTHSRYTTGTERGALRCSLTGLGAGLALLLAMSNAPGQTNIPLNDLKIRAEAGDKTATRQLAEAYYLGKGVDQNFRQAAQWYEKLAKQGDKRAQTSLGLIYARGYGVEKSIKDAVKWWRLAAAQNDPGAQYSLGTVFFEGKDNERNYAEAARLYREAAMRGHVQAQSDLALMYLYGKGVEKNPWQAYYWATVAMEQGDDIAKTNLKEISPELNEAQIKDAETQAKEWMNKAKKMWQ